MKRLFASVLLFVLLCTPALAAVDAPAGTVLSNSTGEVGPLCYGLLDSAGKSFASPWRGGGGDENCMIFFSGDDLYLCRFSSVLDKETRVYNSTHLLFGPSAPSFAFLQFSLSDGKPVPQEDGCCVGYRTVADLTFTGVLIQYKAFLTAGISLSGYEKIWSPVAASSKGAYTLLWDDAVSPAPEEPDAPPEEDTVSDFLSGFWDSFVGLFIPEDGYFEAWFSEVREAFDRRVGGVGGLIAYIRQKSQALKDGSYGRSSLVISLPKDFLYSGFPGVTGDALSGLGPLLGWIRGVLTAIVVLFTAMAVLRRVIALVRN